MNIQIQKMTTKIIKIVTVILIILIIETIKTIIEISLIVLKFFSLFISKFDLYFMMASFVFMLHYNL